MAPAFGDGKVFKQIYAAAVQTPDQQALIHFADDIEHLVIETTVAGAGTNFAWIVPLPAAPEIRPVSEDFFAHVQRAFRSRLIHEVHPYYLAVFFLSGLAYLGWRSLKDEVAWVTDLPLCGLLAGLAYYLGNSIVYGIGTLAFAIYVRTLTHSPKNFSLALLVGVALTAWITIVPSFESFGLIDYLGADNASKEVQEVAGVKVLSVQRAGVFESTTIRGTRPAAVLEWLEKNGYEAPTSAEPALRYYIDHNWVFVASKVQRDPASQTHTALHPLAFTFPVKAPIFPMRLTAVENGNLAVNLYIFGNQRAAAPYFNVVRCDRLYRKNNPSFWSRLNISQPEILGLIGNSTIGTKLAANLTPAQMSADVPIQWGRFRSKGATVYSRHGAAIIGLNTAVALAALSWFLINATRGSWNTQEKQIRRRRWQSIAASLAIGLFVYAFLPKVDVHPVGPPPAAFGNDG